MIGPGRTAPNPVVGLNAKPLYRCVMVFNRLVIASGNPHKVKEHRAIFASHLPMLKIIGLSDLSSSAGGWREPDERGSTFLENARIKAIDYAHQTGETCLADDSGIEIDALALPGGTPRPGVISSHYCTDGRETGMSREERDAANNARVLRELEGVPALRRTARFVCCMCVAAPDGRVLHESRGSFEGRIGVPPRVPAGGHGFGYDPLFLLGPEFETTASELPPSKKNQISHRALAAMGIIQQLRT